MEVMSDESLRTLALVTLGAGIALAGYLVGEMVAWLRDRKK